MNIEQYIGLKYSNEYDCVSFVEEVYKEQLGIDLSIPTRNKLKKRKQLNEDHYDNFIELQQPEDFCLVLMADVSSNEVNHIGIYFNHYIFHNSAMTKQVISTPVSRLELFNLTIMTYLKWQQ